MTDITQVGELLRFVRERGCIGYAVDDVHVIEVLRPDAAAGAEAEQIGALLADHQGAFRSDRR